MSKKKIVLFVHDCHLEIGHSNAMIETIKTLDWSRISSLEIVAYSVSDVKKIFPEHVGLIKVTKVPFQKITPVLLKIIFYHLWTLFYSTFFLSKDCVKISIGIASITSDIVNIQFIHKQWQKLFFEKQEMSFLVSIYKKVLFSYFELCERFIYSNKKRFFLTPANFIKDFCMKNYGILSDHIITAYSGVNLNRFKISSLKREDLFKELKESYPVLNQLDVAHPIFLFVGAYERKGLGIALDLLKKNQNAQIIVVGASLLHTEFVFPADINVFKIPFTKEIQKFYELADAFIFPSIYEPFGLVITEAVSMGMYVFVNRHNVGASEILDKLEGVFFLEDNPSVAINVLDRSTREQFIKSRKERLEKYSWQEVGNAFDEILKLHQRGNIK